jgi:hypothetical protein
MYIKDSRSLMHIHLRTILHMPLQSDLVNFAMLLTISLRAQITPLSNPQ